MRKMSITRKIVIGLFAVNVVAGVMVYPETAAAIGLKEDSIVKNDTLMLGDIFTGLPRNADKIMGVSPQPGHEMVLDSRTLLRIALAQNLPWRPETSGDTVVVRRAATVVDVEMIKSALQNSLMEEGIAGDYHVLLADASGKIILPDDVEPSVEVSNFNLKQDSGFFQATLYAPSKDRPLATQKISGRIERTVKVPVLRESLNAGTIIGQHDIDYIEIPQRNLKEGVALTANDLIGMTPRRMASAGQIISKNELEAPRMVARGEIVTMIFNQNGMELTAQGKALEHGSKGDRIRIVNTSSNKTVVAEVTNTKEVTLNSF